MQITFAWAGLYLNVVLTFVDNDIIKTYVREGMSIGVIASSAYRTEKDRDLEIRNLCSMLPWEIYVKTNTCVAISKS